MLRNASTYLSHRGMRNKPMLLQRLQFFISIDFASALCNAQDRFFHLPPLALVRRKDINTAGTRSSSEQ